MTLDDFYTALLAALASTQATILTEVPEIWPRGRLLRVQVRRPGVADDLPGVLDLLGVVCFAQTGRWYGVLDYLHAAAAIGLEVESLWLIADAQDFTSAELGRKAMREVADVRARLEGVLEAYRCAS